MSLAHTVGNKVELAYRRTDLEKRRRLMSTWGTFFTAPAKNPQNNVRPLRVHGNSRVDGTQFHDEGPLELWLWSDAQFYRIRSAHAAFDPFGENPRRIETVAAHLRSSSAIGPSQSVSKVCEGPIAVITRAIDPE
jgi:hypothetical protein